MHLCYYSLSLVFTNISSIEKKEYYEIIDYLFDFCNPSDNNVVSENMRQGFERH